LSQPTAKSLIEATGGVRPRAVRVPTGRFLSLAEREEIAVGLAVGLSPAQIAGQLGRARSTIGRELRRNRPAAVTAAGGDARVGYRAVPAQRLAAARARRPHPAKLGPNQRLREWVSVKLALRWSPRQIAATLPAEFPDRPEMRVSHETIYQSLYVQSRGGLRRELVTCLRTGRAVRRPARRPVAGRGPLGEMVLISHRPAEVADRAVPGHWEGDLIMGGRDGSAIGTLVERSTRYCLLLHLPQGYQAVRVARAMIDQMGRLPTYLRRSLTWDQGREMARHAEISMALDMPIYFCDPHSPWQRGSNENTNGLLRQYFPKGTDLSVHAAEYLDFVANQLNQRPRQTLGWQTPAQKLNELLMR
jgi:IS30 family transposase